MPGNVYLVGMMGCGKSTVGAALAVRLARPFVDLDREIENSAGATVAEIFRRRGETGFRALEDQALARVAELRGAIVALGGGALIQPDHRGLVQASGLVVWLRARPAELARRLTGGADRPLLVGLGSAARRARLAELLRARRSGYAIADLAIDTDGRTVDELAQSIADWLKERGG
jgi:shikimate kinase